MLLLLAACAPSSVQVGDDPKAPPVPSVSVSGPAAVDPLFGPVYFSLTEVGGTRVHVAVVDGAGATVRTLADGEWIDSVSWDGRDEAGAIAAVGNYTLQVDLADGESTVATTEAELAVVRVGVTAGTFGGERIALCWHAAGGAGMYWDGGTADTTFSIAAIDDGEAVTPIPEPWDDLYEPPEDPAGQNMPAAYAYDARPTLSLVVAGDVAGATLTPAIEGWTLTAGEGVPGATVVFTKDEALTTGPALVETPLVLQWTSNGSVVGTQDIPVRLYALLGPPTFAEEGVPYLPWVGVIDPALRAMGAVEPTEQAVISALVRYIYQDLGLSYDTTWGASAYTEYDWNSFDDAVFDLSAFLDRARGSVVNCTDCAAILEAFANMFGATLEYTILSPGFDLNYIQAIGGDHYTRCPFGGGGCGFSYHAVTTPDDGGLIYDATLALDGDEDPGSYPGEELLVQAIDGAEYLDRLVKQGRVQYVHTQKESIR